MMNTTKFGTQVASAILALGVCSHALGHEPQNLVLDNWIVLSPAEIEVAAPSAGILRHLPAYEGQSMVSGGLLAELDDRASQAALQIAIARSAKARLVAAASELAVQIAQAKQSHRALELQSVTEANRRVQGTVPLDAVRRLKFEAFSAALEVEQLRQEHSAAAEEAKIQEAEVQAAEVELQKHRIFASIAGEVVELRKRQGEWAAQGDVIVRLMRFETMYVEGFVPASAFDPEVVLGKTVKVTVLRAGGRMVQATGRIIYASPELHAGEYRVRAEVTNQRVNGHWQIRPGAKATAEIQF